MRRIHWLLCVSLGALATAGCPEASQPADAGHDPGTAVSDEGAEDAGEDAAPDTLPDPGSDPGPGDLGNPDPGPPDTGPDLCAELCEPFVDCAAAVGAACQETCAAPPDDDLAECERACLQEAADCAAATACLGIDERPPLGFAEGPYGYHTRDTAGGFELPTLRGTFSFEESWTGYDSYLFSVTQTDLDYTEQLWASSPFQWLKNSPMNVHYFFLAYPEPDGSDSAEAKVTAMKAHVEEAMEKIAYLQGKSGECHWRRRIHYVTTQVMALEGLVGDRFGAYAQGHGVVGFAIDRFQKIRLLGNLNPFGMSDVPNMNHFNYELEYYDFEFDREQAAWQGAKSEVVLYDDEYTGGSTLDVELPSAAEMAEFDTLEVDLTAYCPGHDEGQCPAWDYSAYLKVREYPLEETNPFATTACTPAADPTPADTQPCECVVPGGGTRTSQHTCLEDGSGYGDCACNQEIEIARWITTYWREGRWVMDSSFALPLLAAGGKHRFRMHGGNSYYHTIILRFFHQDKADRAMTLTPLFEGGGYNNAYNDGREPVAVPIPASTGRAEIVAFITGHGMGGSHNCAEFCNHTHHFTVGAEEYVYDQPWVGNTYGCTLQVSDGTIPNQFGTWIYGRGGWCPGMDVKPFVADVTDQVTPGQDATIAYEGRFQGDPEADLPGGNIWMSSYLVTYE